ncbi:pyridoxamine 5'-phosphate oxidase family protein [Rhizobium helianthi]|uniref:Pyridoxamine 5'-phosphate oxidase family protein n=1 Tax=Rhizobium helianthi TaxID=1132695 RepID=A0ABW4M3X8_9HYPH
MSSADKRQHLNETVKNEIKNSVLCWLATVDAGGTPNVTPKEIFSYVGNDRIVIADIASSNSVRNIRAQPRVCVSFVDVFRQRGFKIIGTATVIAPEEENFAILGAELLQMAGKDYPIRNVISIEVEKVSRIWAPSYALFPERTEEERMESGYAIYGVRPL